MNAGVVAAKLKKAFSDFETKNGQVDLFGLFLREEFVGGWDVVISANWLDSNERASYGHVVRLLHRTLSAGEQLGISRIAILDAGSKEARDFIHHFKEMSGAVSTYFVTADGEVIRQAYVIAARHPRRAVIVHHKRATVPGRASRDVPYLPR